MENPLPKAATRRIGPETDADAEAVDRARRRIKPYALTVVVVFVAWLARWLLDPWLGDTVVYYTFFFGVLIAAWYGGLGPGIVAAALGALVGDYFFASPRYMLFFNDPQSQSSALRFIMIGIATGYFSGRLRSAQRRADAQAAEVLRQQARLEHEIEERQRTESALREREERFRLLADAAPVLIWLSGTDKLCTWFNKPWLDFTGRTMDQEIGNGWAEGVHPDDFEACLKTYVESFDRREPFTMEYRLRCHDGEQRWVLDNGIPLYGPGGEFAGYVGSCIDITERKHSEVALRKSETRFRSLLRISERLNSTLDVNTLLDILATDAKEFVGATGGVAGLRKPEGMTCEKYFLMAEVLPLAYCWPPGHGLPGWLIEHKVPYLTNDAAHDTQIVPALRDHFGVRSALSTPILNARKEVIGFFELHNKPDGFGEADVQILTALSGIAAIAIENALAYQKVQAAEESLREADVRKDEFLATLAHELRNPLAPIRNALEIMRLAGNNTALVGEAQVVMDRQVRQMVRLVDDLLDLSRITTGKVELRTERIALGAAVDEALESIRPAVAEHGHELTVSLPPEPVYLEADQTRLAQVFANLLGNACKYTPRGGRIALSARRDHGDVVVTVTDSGIGIPPDALPGLFEMFAQVDRSLERGHRGLGVGLALVRGFVEMHHGTVTAHSDGTDQGSTFTVRLPLAAPPTQATALPPDWATALPADWASSPPPEPATALPPASTTAPPLESAIAAPSESTTAPPPDSTTAPPPDSTTAPLAATDPPETPTPQRILVVDDNLDATDTLATMLALLGHEVRTATDGLTALDLAEAFRPAVVVLDIGLPGLNGYDAARRLREAPWAMDTLLIAVTGWGQAADKRRAQEAGFDFHLTKPIDRVDLERLLESRERSWDASLAS